VTDSTLNFDIFARDHASATFNKFGKAVGNSTTGVSSLRKGLGLLVTAFAGLAIITKVTQFMEDSVAQAREAEKQDALTAAAIKSTGGAANVTAAQIADLANTMSLKIGVDDEAIQSGENLLLTFRNIRNEVGAGNDIFNQATVAATDMSAALGKDLNSSVMILGKALNDPIAGLSALTRVGVTFTEKQKALITSLTETGHRMKAQQIILGELKKEFGGAGAAMADPADRARVAWENFQELVGSKVLPILNKLLIWFAEDALPAIEKFAGQLKEKLGPAFEALGGGIRKVRGPLGDVVHFVVENGATFATFVGTVAALAVATRAWAEAQFLLDAALAASPWGATIVALAALTAGVVYARRHSQAFSDAMDRFTHNIASDLNHVADVARALVGAFRSAWHAIDVANNALHNAFAATWNKIRQVVSVAMGGIRSAVSSGMAAVAAVMGSSMGRMVTAVARGVTRILALILGLPGRMVGALESLAGILYNVGLNAMQGFLDGIKAKIGEIVDTVTGLAGQVSGAISGALGIGSPSKVFHQIGLQTMAGLADGLAEGAGKLGTVAIPVPMSGMDQPYRPAGGWTAPTGATRGGITRAEMAGLLDHLQIVLVDGGDRRNAYFTLARGG
jgi:hypothetical protein